MATRPSAAAAGFGAPIEESIDRRLGLVSLVFCVCLVGGFYLINVVL